jgi:hypothetical protein
MYRPPQVENPVDAYGKMLSLENLKAETAQRQQLAPLVYQQQQAAATEAQLRAQEMQRQVNDARIQASAYTQAMKEYAGGGAQPAASTAPSANPPASAVPAPSPSAPAAPAPAPEEDQNPASLTYGLKSDSAPAAAAAPYSASPTLANLQAGPAVAPAAAPAAPAAPRTATTPPLAFSGTVQFPVNLNTPTLRRAYEIASQNGLSPQAQMQYLQSIASQQQAYNKMNDETRAALGKQYGEIADRAMGFLSAINGDPKIANDPVAKDQRYNAFLDGLARDRLISAQEYGNWKQQYPSYPGDDVIRQAAFAHMGASELAKLQEPGQKAQQQAVEIAAKKSDLAQKMEQDYLADVAMAGDPKALQAVNDWWANRAKLDPSGDSSTILNGIRISTWTPDAEQLASISSQSPDKRPKAYQDQLAHVSQRMTAAANKGRDAYAKEYALHPLEQSLFPDPPKIGANFDSKAVADQSAKVGQTPNEYITAQNTLQYRNDLLAIRDRLADISQQRADKSTGGAQAKAALNTAIGQVRANTIDAMQGRGVPPEKVTGDDAVRFLDERNPDGSYRNWPDMDPGQREQVRQEFVKQQGAALRSQNTQSIIDKRQQDDATMRALLGGQPASGARAPAPAAAPAPPVRTVAPGRAPSPPPQAIADRIPEGRTATGPDGTKWRKQNGRMVQVNP